MTFRRTALAVGAALTLASCGGSDYPNADPTVAGQINDSESCDRVESLANAWNARYESYEEGTAARTEARETFLLAADRLGDLDCPGW